jgi:hypothetical protein
LIARSIVNPLQAIPRVRKHVWSFLPGGIGVGNAVSVTCAPGEGTRFRVWAPRAERVEVKLIEPAERVVELASEAEEGTR